MLGNAAEVTVAFPVELRFVHDAQHMGRIVFVLNEVLVLVDRDEFVGADRRTVVGSG